MMKLSKKICAFSVAAVMSLSVCAPAFAEEAENKVDVQFNGATTEDAAVLTEGTTYLKAADVKALFGVDCTVTDGKAVLTVDGQAVNVDAQVAEGDLIPVRAIATALGCSLGWDDAAKTVVVIDVDKMAADNGATFEIIGKYMDYALSLGDNYKTTSEFSGNVEVVDDTATISLPFSGTTEGITSAKGEEMTMKLALDFKQITEMLEAQGIADSEKETLDAIIKALENSETKYIYDMEKNIFYMNSTLFTALGLSADTWVSLDLGVLFEMSGATGLDLTSILDLAMSGDIQAYIVELLKTTPIDSVNSYAEIAEAYDVVAKMLGDNAFILADGQYKSTYAVNEDGVEVTYAMTMGTDGEKINSCDITLKIAAEGLSMNIDATSDKDFNSTMTFSMNMLDMMKMSMDFKSASAATTEEPVLTLPEGVTVISLDQLLMGAISISADGEVVEAIPETAAEATAESTEAVADAAEETAEVPETTETAETTETTSETAETTEAAETVETVETVETAETAETTAA